MWKEAAELWSYDSAALVSRNTINVTTAKRLIFKICDLRMPEATNQNQVFPLCNKPGLKARVLQVFLMSPDKCSKIVVMALCHQPCWRFTRMSWSKAVWSPAMNNHSTVGLNSFLSSSWRWRTCDQKQNQTHCEDIIQTPHGRCLWYVRAYLSHGHKHVNQETL